MFIQLQSVLSLFVCVCCWFCNDLLTIVAGCVYRSFTCVCDIWVSLTCVWGLGLPAEGPPPPPWGPGPSAKGPRVGGRMKRPWVTAAAVNPGEGGGGG